MSHHILVTGGAGYLGSILTPALLAAGHRVTVVDSFLYGQTSLLDCCNNPALDIIRGDVRAYLHALDHFDAMQGQAYNIGLSDANLSKMELCLEIKKQLPAFTIMEAPVGKDPDQRNYIVSNEKIEATGFQPKTSLPDAIRELIKGYQVIRRNQYANI